jgi:hypothetical protein
MFKFKDIIKMDYETCKRMITKINESQSEFILQVNKDQSSLDMKLVGHDVIEHYPFSVEPWMEPEE